MADTTDAGPRMAAPGHHFTHAGKEYYLPRLIQKDKRDFHAWANARAWADVRAMEPLVAEGEISREDFDRLADVTHTKITAGFYGFSEPGGVERRMTRDGLIQLVWLAMRRHDQAATRETVAAIAAADAATLQAAFVMANSDPNHPAPAAAGA